MRSGRSTKAHIFVKSLIAKLKLYGFRLSVSYCWSELKNIVMFRFVKGSYSQSQEDLVVDELLGHRRHGFYVDVGANDPKRFNNTKRLYKRGWRGVNIEPNSIMYGKLVKDRRGDVNLNIAIGPYSSRMNMYKYFPNLFTLSEEEAQIYRRKGYKFMGTEEVEVRRLDEVLSQYSDDRELDFMSIDAEGFEMEVLESNNWDKFRPSVICIESVRIDTIKPSESDKQCHEFLEKIGYRKIRDIGANSIYMF